MHAHGTLVHDLQQTGHVSGAEFNGLAQRRLRGEAPSRALVLCGRIGVVDVLAPSLGPRQQVQAGALPLCLPPPQP